MTLAEEWDANAEDWVGWARAPGHDSYWSFHRRALLGLLPAPGRLTIDLGCGEGRVARDLEVLGHRVVGLDRSPAMTVAARRHDGPRVPVVLADAAHLPVADGAADLVLAFMSLQDIDEPGRTVTEAARVLGPGGVLHVAVVHPVNSGGAFVAPGPARSPFVLAESYFERRIIRDDIERDGRSMRFVSEHRTIEFYARLLEDAGFVIEMVREVGDPDPEARYHRVPLFLHLAATVAPWRPRDRRLFHIAWPAEWRELEAEGQRSPPSLATEGFVHLSTVSQVVGSTERHFPSDAELLLIELDPERLADDVRWPEVYPGQRFPHLHGPLTAASVRGVHPWSVDDRRRWSAAQA